MTDILFAVVSEAKHAFPTLSQLSEADVDNIWSDVSSFIVRQMSFQKGVHISGLGRFTFCQQKMDVGSKFVLIQRPVFLLSEKLSQTYGLRQVKPLLAAGDVPEVSLNFSALAAESPFEREVIEGCIRETLMLLLRAVASQRSVLFTFRGIGVLVFRNLKVKMHFYKDFVTNMDGSGKALWALSNRPGSSNSLLSERFSSQARPRSSSTIQLPHIPSRAEGEVGKAYSKPSSPCDRAEEQNKGASKILSQSKYRKGSSTARDDGVNTNKLYTKPTKSHQTQSVDRMAEQQPAQNVEKEKNTHVSLTCQDHRRAGQELCYLCMQRARRNIPLYLSEEREREEKEDARLLHLLEQQKDNQYLQDVQAEKNQIFENKKKVAEFNFNVAEALKKRRSMRSSEFYPSYIFGGRPDTPLNLSKRQAYQEDLKSQASSLRQNQKLNQQSQDFIDHLQQVQLSHEISQQKAQFVKKKCDNSESYRKALDIQMQAEQVKPKVHFKKRLLFPPINKDCGRTERAEQVGEYKGTGIPAYVPDSDGPIFGVLDNNPEDLAKRRRMAQALQQEQLLTATQGKKEAMFNKLIQLKRERDMLKRNHRELIQDEISHYEKLCNWRKSLEMTWSRSADLKRQRDKEERNFIRSGSRLLLSQCEQYHRCNQCKRLTGNCGESNIWKETRFVPGSRLMV